MPGGLLAAIDTAPAPVPQPAPRQGGGLLAAIDAPAPPPTPLWRYPLEYAGAALHAADEGGSQLLGGLASAGAGALNQAGILPDAAADAVNQGAGRLVREAQEATARDVPADVPFARDVAHVGGAVIPFLTPAGMAGGAVATGGNSYRGALEEGATPNEAAAKGAISGGVAALLPKVFEAAAPVAEASGGAVGGLLAKIAGEPVGNLAGKLVERSTQGAAGGAAMGLGEAAGTQLYNPELAQERLREIPDDATDLAVLGGLHGAVEGVPAAIAEARAARATRNQQSGQQFAQAYDQAEPGVQRQYAGPIPEEFTPAPNPEEGAVQAAQVERDAEIRAQLRSAAVDQRTQQRQGQVVDDAYRNADERAAAERQQAQEQANDAEFQRLQAEEAAQPPRSLPEATGRAPDEPVGPSRAERVAAIVDRRQAVQAQFITDMQAIRDARQNGTMGKPQAFTAKQQAAAKRDAAMARIGIPEPTTTTEATAPPGDSHDQEHRLWPLREARLERQEGRAAAPEAGRQDRDARPQLGGRPVQVREGVEGRGRDQGLGAADAEVQRPRPAGSEGQPEGARRGEPQPARAEGQAPEVSGLRGLNAEMRRQFPHLPAEHVDTALALVEARARAVGLPVDRYVAERFAVHTKGQAGEAFDQRLPMPADASRERLLKGWRRSNGDPTPVSGRAGWRSLAERSDAIDDARRRAANRDLAEKPTERISRLHQERQGMVQFIRDGRAVIRGFQAGNVSTLVHELGHVFRRDLSPQEMAVAAKWAGATGPRWSRAAEEKFARGFEQWTREGVAPTPELRGVFQQFFHWLHEIYQTVANIPGKVELSPEIRDLFARMLRPGAQAAERVPRGTSKTSTAEATHAEPAPAPVRAEGRAPRAAAGEPTEAPAQVATIPGRPIQSRQKLTQPVVEGAHTVAGRLHNPGESDAAREVINRADRALDEESGGTPKYTNDAVRAAADARLADDYEGRKSKIFGTAAKWSDLRTETAEAGKIMNAEAEKVARDPSPANIREQMRINRMFRLRSSSIGAALQLHYDPRQSPAERARSAMQATVFTPSFRLMAQEDRLNQMMRKATDKGDVAAQAKLKAKLDQLEQRQAAEQKQVLDRLRGTNLAWALDKGRKPSVDDMMAVNNVVQAARERTRDLIGDVLSEFRMSALLSGLKTVAKNSIPAYPLTGTLILKPVEAVLRAVYKRNPAYLREITDIYGHMLNPVFVAKAMGRAFHDAGRSFWTGRSIVDERIRGTPQELDLQGNQVGDYHTLKLPRNLAELARRAGGGNRTAAAAKGVGHVLAWGIKAHQFGDALNKSWVTRSMVSAFARRSGLDAGLKGEALTHHMADQVADQQSEAWKSALDSALEWHFQKDSSLSHVGNKVRDLGGLSEITREATGIHPGMFLLPFNKGPSSLITEGFKMSPLGAIGMAVSGVMGRAGKIEYGRDHFISDLAKFTVGMGLTYTMAHWISGRDDQGHPLITGSIDAKNPAESALASKTMPAYTVNIGGQWVNYTNVEPYKGPLQMYVDTAQAMNRGHGAFGAALSAVVRRFADVPAIQTLTDLGRALTSEADKGMGKVPTDEIKGLKDWAQNLALSYALPNIVPQVINATDPYLRKTISAEDQSFMGSLGQKWDRKTDPTAQPLRYDFMGNPIEKAPGTAQTALPWLMLRQLNPVDVTTPTAMAPIYARIQQYNDTPGNDPWFPSVPTDSYVEKGVKKQLTPAQYEQMARTAGQAMQTLLDDPRMQAVLEKPLTPAVIKALKQRTAVFRRNARNAAVGGVVTSPDDEPAE